MSTKTIENLGPEKEKIFAIGARLKSIRESLRLTLEKISQDSGTSRSYISAFERGIKLPTTKYLLYLHQTHRVNIHYTLTGIGEMFITQEDEKTPMFDFGKHEEEIRNLLFHITRVPHAFHTLMAYFEEYKTINRNLIADYLKKIGKGK